MPVPKHIEQKENLALLAQKNVPINRPLLASFLASIMSFSSGTVVAGWSVPQTPVSVGESLFIMANMEKSSWIVSIYVIGALVGALLVGYIKTSIGRKRLILLLAIPMTLGWLIIMFFVNNIYMIYLGRLLCGLSLGAVTVAVPLYNYDIAPDVCRGRGGVFLDFMLCAGILYSYLASSVMGLYIFSFTCSLIPIVFCALFSFMPETPQYLYSRGRYVDAKTVLIWLRGKDFDVNEEFDKYSQLNQVNSPSDESLLMNKERERTSTKAIVLSLALATIQRMSGAGAIIQYTAKLFKISGSSISPITASIITGIFQLIGSGITIVLIDKVGRRKLLLISSSVVVTCLALLTTYFYCLDKGILGNSFKTLPIVIVCIFISFFRLGLGPIPWFMTSELLGSGHKTYIQSYVASYSWTLSFFVMQSFIPLVNEWPVALWFGYSIMSATGLLFILFFIPETNNKSSDEIQILLKKIFHINRITS